MNLTAHDVQQLLYDLNAGGGTTGLNQDAISHQFEGFLFGLALAKLSPSHAKEVDALFREAWSLDPTVPRAYAPDGMALALIRLTGEIPNTPSSGLVLPSS